MTVSSTEFRDWSTEGPCPGCEQPGGERYEGLCWNCFHLARPELDSPVEAAEADVHSIDVVAVADFISEDEAGAEPLVGTEDAILIPQGGDCMIFGDGGAGKTTLCIDLAAHLVSGQDWLGISVPKAVRVLLIENEGPRPLFRKKLRRKAEAWGSALDGLMVLEAPWGRFSFASERWREQLALQIVKAEVDVLIAGPLTRIGMDEAGTLQQVRAFGELVADLRRRSLRPLTVILVHHESKSGAVSGAWEGAGDSLLHVEAAGNGHTIVHVQKARWSSEHHHQTFKLAWTEGEGFELEGERDLDAEVVHVLSDRPWLTVKEIGAPKEDNPPGIGAREQAIKKIVEGNPEQFESRTGDDARKLGRHPNATLWRVRPAPVAHVADSLFGASADAREVTSASTPAVKGVDVLADVSDPVAHVCDGSRSQTPDAPAVQGPDSVPGESTIVDSPPRTDSIPGV